MLCPLCQFDNPAHSKRCRACGAALGTRSSENGAAPDALPGGTTLAGTYAVESVLGQGGFGITYRCHDRMLDRRVAVKEFFPAGCRRRDADVQPSRGLSEAHYRDARAQFLAEARVLARCHHPGIVAVYTAFEANATAYMVMEMLHGKSLGQLLSARGGRLDEAEAVGIIERVGAALQFVHDLELLHRDIKPDNIIACDDGRVMLIDFGTAREYIKDQVQGQTVVVTPGYAPLEQYAKQARRGAYTDIYSLAATLYHLLTGQMPPAASDRAMGVVLRPVREVNPRVSAGVARAVENALQMEIAKRPQSVREFLDALKSKAPVGENKFDRLLVKERADLNEDDEESSAPHLNLPPLPTAPFLDLSWALQTRQQMLGGVLPPAYPQPAPLAVPANANAQPVKIAPPSVFSASATPAKATPSVSPSSSSPFAGGSVGVKNSPGPSNSTKVARWLCALFIGYWLLAIVLGFGGTRSHSTSSYDSPPISYNYQSPPSNYVPNTSQTDLKRESAQRAWDALPVLLPASVETLPDSKEPKPQKAANAKFPSWRGGVEFSPDGKRLAAIDSQSVLQVFSLPTRRVLRALALDKTVSSLDAMFSRDNQTIAVSQIKDQGGSVQNQLVNQVSVWSLRTGKQLGVFTTNAKEEWVQPQAMLNDGQMLLRTFPLESGGAALFQWNPKTGKRAKTPLPNVSNWGYGVISPDADEFVIGDAQGRLRWLNLRTGTDIAQHDTTLTEADYKTRFGTFLFNRETNASLGVRGIDYSLNGSWLASRNAAEISVFNSHAHKVGALTIDGSQSPFFSMSPDGKWLAAQGSLPYSPKGMLLWNVKTGRKIRLQAPSESLLDLGFSGDGKQLYGIFAQGNHFQFVSWQTNAPPVATYANPTDITFQSAATRSNPSTSLAQSNRLIAIPGDSAIQVYYQDGTPVKTLAVSNPETMALGFSPDGQFLAGRSYSSAIQIWSVKTGKSMAQLKVTKAASQNYLNSPAYRNNSRNLAFSPDSTLFACARPDGASFSVELWSLGKAPRLLASLPQTEPVTALTFSPDNKSLICGDGKGLLQWVDVATRQLRTQTQTGDSVLETVFTARNLVVVGGSKTTLFELPSKSATAKSALQRVAQLKIPIGFSGMANPSDPWAVSADGQLLATTKPNGQIQLWQLPTGFPLQSLPQSQNGMSPLSSLAFTADGTQLISVRRQFVEGQLQVKSWTQTKVK